MDDKLKAIMPDTMKRILAMPESEKNTEIAYWALEPNLWDEIRIKPEPTPPDDLIELRKKPSHDRSKVSEKFWFQAHVASYNESVRSIRTENNSNYYWLKAVLSYLPKDDQLNRSKVQQKINQFTNSGYPMVLHD